MHTWIFAGKNSLGIKYSVITYMSVSACVCALRSVCKLSNQAASMCFLKPHAYYYIHTVARFLTRGVVFSQTSKFVNPEVRKTLYWRVNWNRCFGLTNPEFCLPSLLSLKQVLGTGRRCLPHYLFIVKNEHKLIQFNLLSPNAHRYGGKRQEIG